MKTKFILLATLFLSFVFGNAQVGQLYNNEFQIWTDPHTPDGWMTLDSLFGGYGLSGTSVRDSSDAALGQPFSLKLSAVAFELAPGGVVPGLVALGGGAVVNNAPVYPGIPFHYRPDTISFVYQYKSTVTDTPTVQVVLSKNDTAILEGAIVLDTTPNSEWGTLTWTISGGYASNENPDTLRMLFATSASNTGVGTLGDVLHLQIVLLGYDSLPTGLKEIADNLNLSIYPNPASQTVNISSAGDVSGYKMVVSDINGKLVGIYTLEGYKSQFDVTSFASGTYLYRLADPSGNILKQDKFIVTR